MVTLNFFLIYPLTGNSATICLKHATLCTSKSFSKLQHTTSRQIYLKRKILKNDVKDRRNYTDDFRLERWLYFEVLQFLPVDIAIEEVIFNFTFLARSLTAAKSGIRCLRQQLYAEKTPYIRRWVLLLCNCPLKFY